MENLKTVLISVEGVGVSLYGECLGKRNEYDTDPSNRSRDIIIRSGGHSRKIERNAAAAEGIIKAKARIGHFIGQMYHQKPPHSALGYLTPAEFEKQDLF